MEQGSPCPMPRTHVTAARRALPPTPCPLRGTRPDKGAFVQAGKPAPQFSSMIVRINQLDAARAEQDAGWPGVGPLGPLKGVPSASPSPPELRTFELLILGHDEQNRPLPDVFRQAQLRQIIPQALIALREGDE